MTGIVELLAETVGIATTFHYETVRMTTEEAEELLAHIEALEGTARLVVRKFDGIEDHKWPTKGMQIAIERMRKVLSGEVSRE